MLWTIGHVEITRVVEQTLLVAPDRLFRNFDHAELAAEREWLAPDFLDTGGDLRMSIHSFALRSEGLTILVDTCVGDDKVRSSPGMSGLRTGFLERLDVAGVKPDAVDMVLCTHLHFDHVGWNTTLVDGRWVPTFPNARYLVSRQEWEHWSGERAGGAPNRLDRDGVLADSVQPVVDAGLVDLVDSDHHLSRDVRLEPTPGHTPGHVSVCIESDGGTAVITGDSFHHPVQIAKPGWGTHADVDPELAVATRLAFVSRYSGTDTLVMGSHFGGPTAGWIRQRGGSTRLDIGQGQLDGHNR